MHYLGRGCPLSHSMLGLPYPDFPSHDHPYRHTQGPSNSNPTSTGIVSRYFGVCMGRFGLAHREQHLDHVPVPPEFNDIFKVPMPRLYLGVQKGTVMGVGTHGDEWNRGRADKSMERANGHI